MGNRMSKATRIRVVFIPGVAQGTFACEQNIKGVSGGGFEWNRVYLPIVYGWIHEDFRWLSSASFTSSDLRKKTWTPGISLLDSWWIGREFFAHSAQMLLNVPYNCW